MNPSDKEIWVFLSHSNKDYDKVRQVRNILEDENLRPLMLFLCCMKDDEELNDLIKREIDCRSRFILCDSNNAKNSDWVKKEVDYIKSKDRLYETVDLSKSIEEIKNTLKQFITRTRIFVSYNREEAQLAKSFALRMQKYEFKVYMDMLYDYSQTYTQDYAYETLNNLNVSSRNGVVVAFINKRVFQTSDESYGTCRYELIKAIENSRELGLKKPNTIVFAKDKSLVDCLSQDKTLSPLCKSMVIPLDNISDLEKCNLAVKNALLDLMPKDSILTHANNLKMGINCKKDEQEAEWLFRNLLS